MIPHDAVVWSWHSIPERIATVVLIPSMALRVENSGMNV